MLRRFTIGNIKFASLTEDKLSELPEKAKLSKEDFEKYGGIGLMGLGENDEFVGYILFMHKDGWVSVKRFVDDTKDRSFVSGFLEKTIQNDKVLRIGIFVGEESVLVKNKVLEKMGFSVCNVKRCLRTKHHKLKKGMIHFIWNR